MAAERGNTESQERNVIADVSAVNDAERVKSQAKQKYPHHGSAAHVASAAMQFQFINATQPV